MAILPQPTVDHTDRDFEALRLRLQGLARSVFPDWTDFNVGSFGSVLLEMMAYVGDMTSFYLDRRASEAFWPTVTQRISAVRLGRLINFKLRSAQPATVSVRFSLPAAAIVRVPLPVGRRVRTTDVGGAVRFRTTVEAAIEVGDTQVDVAAEQAVLISGEGFDSTGGPNQEYRMARSPYIDSTVTAVATDGTYLEVQSFLDPDPLTGGLITADSRVFVVLVDVDDRARLRFGNGNVGKIPQGRVELSYKIGGGAAGNVEAGKIVVMEDTILDEGGNVPAGLRVTNPLAASGGVDRQTVLQARAAGPASLRVLTRTVAREDFVTGALEVPSVARAVMVTSNEDAGVQENTGHLLVVAQGARLASGRIAPASPSTTLLDQVLTRVTTIRPHTLTFSLIVEAAPFRDINVSARVYLERGTSATIVGAAIRASLADFFAAQLSEGLPNPDIDFGANIVSADGAVVPEIAWSDVFNAVRDTVGVRKVDEGVSGLLLNSRRSSVTILPREFPRLGTVSVVDVDSGAAL